MKFNILALTEAVAVCNLHAKRLNDALGDCKQYNPLTLAVMLALSKEEIYVLDSLVLRFAQLQDSIDNQTFPLLLQMLYEDSARSSYLDRLHKLEKLQLIESEIFWLDLRTVRNELVHESPYEMQQVVEQLNLCLKKSVELLEYWRFLSSDVAKRVETALLIK